MPRAISSASSAAPTPFGVRPAGHAIEAEIRHRIIGQVLALEPDSVSVSVDEGRVELNGLVPAKPEAQLLADLVPGVDGVMSVDSRVRYQVDDTVRTDERWPYGVPRPNW